MKDLSTECPCSPQQIDPCAVGWPIPPVAWPRSVARTYIQQGHELIAERWRGRSGEIDLILRRGEEYIFVEVKKSSSHSRAAERIGGRQIARICRAALEFCGRLPTGMMTAMRFDAALVDQFGRVDIVENAFGMN